MTIDLAFWKGPQPTTDEEALRIYEDLFPEDDEDLDPEPPGPEIQAFIAALEKRWPPFDEDSPWAMAPLGDDARGETLYLCLTPDSYDDALEETIAAMARVHGLVCFSPLSEGLV